MNLPQSRRESFAGEAARALIEPLEGRQLLAAQVGLSGAPALTSASTVATRAATNPSVAVVRPGNGATGVRRDGFVACDLNLVKAGLNPATLAGNVRLIKVSSGAAVAGKADTSGGGDVITFQPSALLEANTKYQFVVTNGVKDASGAAMVPFTSTFTTGTAGGAVSTNIAFTKVPQSAAQGKAYTAVTVGPDGKVYAASYDGVIQRWNVGNDGTLSGLQVISTVNTANGGQRTITGIVFDPSSTASNLVAWVTHSQKADFNGLDFTGKVSRLSGASLGTYKDFVTGLPRSVRDHLTNQAAFGPDGALYVSQGANNAMGAPDAAWGQRVERLLSAAILRVDVKAIAATGATINAKTIDAGGSYNPYAAGAPVTLYATGVRNGYDVVWHSNGKLYTAVNGSAAGGNAPASSNTGRRPSAGTAYSGPKVPGLTNIRQTENDWLFKIDKGGYYGHPNPSRGEFVYNGGNPTAGADPQEVSAYPVGTKPDVNFRRAAYDFGKNYSPNGIIEYKSNTFGGALKGKLLVVRYSGGDDIIGLTVDASGGIDASKTVVGAKGMTGFNDAVDLIEFRNPANPSDVRNGMIFVAEYGGKRITLLRPGTNTVPGPGAAPTLSGVSLMNAANDTVVGAFTNNAVIDTSGGKQWTLRAEAGAGTIGSVVFKVDGVVVRTESYAPWSIAGEDATGNYSPWNVPAGKHTLTVTPFTEKNGAGVAGTPITINFTASGSSTGTVTGAGNFTGTSINGAAGSTTKNSAAAWTVKSNGTGINGAKDQFHFANQLRTGDFDVKVKLQSLAGGAAGLVARGGVSGSNSQVAILFNSGIVSFGSRTTFGGNYVSSEKGTGTAGNIWLRMRRVGNVFTTFFGTNGTTWTQAGSATVSALPNALYFGFFVASGNSTQATASFTNATG